MLTVGEDEDAAETVTDKAAEAVLAGDDESATRTVKLNWPETKGVPAICPDDAKRDKPLGSCPEEMLQV